MATIRHEFYETDEKLTLSIFDKGADPAQVSIKFEPRKVRSGVYRVLPCPGPVLPPPVEEPFLTTQGQFTYTHGEKMLILEPLKGQIDPDASNYTVGKVKVEVRFVKRAQGRWGELVGDTPDPLSTTNYPAPSEPAPAVRKPRKNWDGITTTILSSEKEKTTEEDPNVGGDSTLNSFFQKIFGDADDDTKRAMMKSYQESGGTTLSTNWDDVKKGKVEVKPPAGSEWKKWN